MRYIVSTIHRKTNWKTKYDVRTLMQKNNQHVDFPGGHPPEYYPRLSLVNFIERTGYGSLRLIWPIIIWTSVYTILVSLQYFYSTNNKNTTSSSLYVALSVWTFVCCGDTLNSPCSVYCPGEPTINSYLKIYRPNYLFLLHSHLLREKVPIQPTIIYHVSAIFYFIRLHAFLLLPAYCYLPTFSISPHLLSWDHFFILQASSTHKSSDRMCHRQKNSTSAIFYSHLLLGLATHRL